MVSVSIKTKPVLKFGGVLYLNGCLLSDSFPVKIFAFFPESQTSHLVFTEGDWQDSLPESCVFTAAQAIHLRVSPQM